MESLTEQTLLRYNDQLRSSSPEDVVIWALGLGGLPVVTTNFGPYEAALLHCVTHVIPDIEVIWCDTGYNTSFTYKHADEVSNLLRLNLKIYVPKQTVGYRSVIMGQPDIDHPDHPRFTEEVKLEPFRRAMAEIKPEIWFTNIRKGQTAVRDRLDILSLTQDSVLKISPFYYWDDQQLDSYMELYQLPNETRYFDPTKVEANRECGLHT